MKVRNSTTRMKMLAVGVVAAVLMSATSAMAADWPNARGTEANTGRSTEALSLPLTERWHSSAPAVEENGAVASKGIVYMSSAAGKLYAFDGTGAPVAGFPVNTAFNYGSPAVDAVNAQVYVLAGGVLFAFKLNGAPAWTANVGSTGTNYNVGPIVDGGFVYLRSGGSLQKYSSAGTQQWSTPGPGNNTQPAIMGGYVYVNTEAGQIRKYDKATGAEVTTGGFPISTPPSQAGLAVTNGRIFHKADQLYAYDATTGATAWAKPDGGFSTYYDSPAVANGVVYVYGWDSKMYAFDEATGATQAGFPSAALATPSDRNYGSPSVAGNLVFIGAGTTQKLKVLGAAGSASAGTVVEEHLTASADTQGFDLTSPVISEGVVYAMLDGGGLYAFFASGTTFSGGSISINGGAPCTQSQAVILAISAGANLNVSEMRISEDPLFASAAFGPYATSKSFTLSPGFGTKTVYIQFRNTSGAQSNVFNAHIAYSQSCSRTTPPACTRTITGDVIGPFVANAGGVLCINKARVVGPVTVNTGGALIVTDSQISRGVSANAPVFVSLCKSSFSSPGVTVNGATGPVILGDPASSCAADRFVGTVDVSANTAGVVLGGASVSGNVSVNSNSGGAITVKGNTIMNGSLSCASNNPAPTNATQVNTATGGKNGQCASL